MKTNSLCFLLFVVEVTLATDILMLTPLGSKSHLTPFEHIARALAEKNYKITVFSSYPISNEPIPNVKEYKLPQPELPENEDYMKQVFKQQKSEVLAFPDSFEFLCTCCENMFKHEEIKTLIEKVQEKGPIYEVAFVNALFCECALPLARISAKHIILISSLSLPHWIANNYNIPAPLSTIPNYFTELVTPMTFSERFYNTWSGYFIDGFYRFGLVAGMQTVADKYLPEGTPKIEEAMKDVSFIFCNSDPVSGIPRPSMPFIADIGGIHLQKTKPVPKEFEDFLNSSGEDGTIMFGLGSILKAKFLPDEIRDAFIKAFARLKQKVLWKFEAELEGLPANVKIVKWMPQQDLLAHPKIRLFITHSGRFSLQEATYHGVPIIGIPVWGDQHHNIRLAKSNGYAEELSFLNITADGVYETIMKILNDKRYKEKAKEASLIMKDSLISPKEKAVYWTEYVIRHKGAHHLKNKGAQEQGFIQFLLLDVLTILSLVFLFTITISIIILRYLWKLIINILFTNKKQKIN